MIGYVVSAFRRTVTVSDVVSAFRRTVTISDVVSAFRRTVTVRLPAFALRASARPRRSSVEYGRSGGGKPDTTYYLAVALGAAVALMPSLAAHRDDISPGKPAYVLIDAATERVLDARWDDLDRPVPIGSLIKPFTALAYADTHRFTYPTFACRGTADGCWLPAGHGRVGLTEAVALSCNAYFRQLAQRTTPDALVARLQLFGMPADLAAATPAAMVGYGDALKLAPPAVMRGYLELVSRAGQPGVSPIVQGMRASARTGTGRGVGAAIGAADALVKTGTAPCSHSPRAMADGYTIVIYPADRPRVVLLMQAHGRTGAETAVFAGELLTSALGTR